MPGIFTVHQRHFIAVVVALVCFFLFLAGQQASAQLDPSSALLLNGRGDGKTPANRETGLDSGRYTVRPKPEGSVRRDEAARTPQRKVQAPTEPENPEATVVVVDTPQAPRVEQAPAPTIVQPSVVILREESHGKSQPQFQITPAPREPNRKLSLLELTLSPGFVYTDSASNFSYRSYSMSAPSLEFGARVWLSPYLAIDGSYLTTLSGSVVDSLVGARSVPATAEWVSLGLRSRKVFGPGMLSPVLVFGLDYSEFQFKVPSDALMRAKVGSTGANFSLEAELPSSVSHAWVLGFAFSPKLQHKESPGATLFRSGGNVDSSSVGASVGGKFILDKQDTVFWKLTHTIEKNVFSGTASVVDPLTAVAPTGVNVMTSSTLINFGYIWGN